MFSRKDGHPLGSFIHEFSELFIGNYDPPEDACKYFSDLLEDVHAIIGNGFLPFSLQTHSLLKNQLVWYNKC